MNTSHRAATAKDKLAHKAAGAVAASLLVGWVTLFGAAPAWAQTVSARETDRQRVSQERAQAQAKHEAASRACYQRFVVTSCLDDARAERRRVLDELQRQESLLNDAERRERAQERLQRIDLRVEQRAAEEQRNVQAAASRAAAAASAALPLPALPVEPMEPDTQRAAQAEQRRQDALTAQQRAAQREAQSRARSSQAAAVRADTQARQQDAAERRLERDRRIADPSRRPASDLPLPPRP